MLCSKKRHITNGGPQLTCFEPKNAVLRTGAPNDLLWSKKRHITNLWPKITARYFCLKLLHQFFFTYASISIQQYLQTFTLVSWVQLLFLFCKLFWYWVLCCPTGGEPRIVGPGYTLSGNIWRFPNVSHCASGAQFISDTYSNSTFTLPPLVQKRHMSNAGR